MRKLIKLYNQGGLGEIKRGIHDFFMLHSFKYFAPIYGGELIWDYDWDILCILDGCRLDTFEEVYSGESSSIKSVGSTSPEWIQNTFVDYDTSNVGYISANPYSAKLDPNQFGYFHLVPVELTEHDIETVDPTTLTDIAIKKWKSEKDIERLIIHYMQPHVPFRSRPEWFNQKIGSNGWGAEIWRQLRGDINKDDLFEAYQDNLEWVLEEGVKILTESVDATVAISADHGNAAGEWGVYGHPWGCPIKEVRHVPWATINASDKGDHIPSNLETEKYDIEHQLEALGYK